jgi:hypothetical protein
MIFLTDFLARLGKRGCGASTSISEELKSDILCEVGLFTWSRIAFLEWGATIKDETIRSRQGKNEKSQRGNTQKTSESNGESGHENEEAKWLIELREATVKSCVSFKIHYFPISTAQQGLCHPRNLLGWQRLC